MSAHDPSVPNDGDLRHGEHGFKLWPAEAAVGLAAQFHGIFVWLVVLAGLSRFRSYWTPGVTAYWMFGLPQWVAIAAISTATAALAARTIATS